MKPTIGIIGGSGPLATIDIEQKILFATQKTKSTLTDQDYFNLVVFNYCDTYDRNDAVFLGKADPLSQYMQYISSISALGVDLILLACNTAHMYLPLLREKAKTPIISLVEKTLHYIQMHFPKCGKVGLLSTQATLEKKLYHNLFSHNHIDVIDVTSQTQDAIMEAIYLIKSGVSLTQEERFTKNTHFPLTINSEQTSVLKNHPHKQILLQQQLPNPKFIISDAIEEFKKKGCKHIIFGCTELPLIIPFLEKEPDLHFIDPNAIIADAIVKTLSDFEEQEWSNVTMLNNKRYM